jgi:hypothetical protein
MILLTLKSILLTLTFNLTTWWLCFSNDQLPITSSNNSAVSTFYVILKIVPRTQRLLRLVYIALMLKSWQQRLYGYDHKLVDCYEIFISQMANDLFPLRRCSVLYITWLWVTQCVSNKKQFLHFSALVHPRIVGRVRVAHHFSFLCFFLFVYAVSCVQCHLCFWVVHS